jgi:hypothetical protein
MRLVATLYLGSSTGRQPIPTKALSGARVTFFAQHVLGKILDFDRGKRNSVNIAFFRIYRNNMKIKELQKYYHVERPEQ